MTMAPLKLISINIEGRKHLDLVLPFLREQNPDVVCLQEVYEPDFQMFINALGMKGHFAPMTLNTISENSPLLPWGVCILTALPFTEAQKRYYYGNGNPIPVFVDNIKTMYKVLVSGVVRKGGVPYTIGTTHFTWTPNGEADEHQRHDMPALLAELEKFPEIVFCGDFNAPRGREIFTMLSCRYKDNIPLTYETSIDGNLHRDGKLKVMVDGLFSTPQYRAENVALVSGVSDHCAIIAKIFKV